MIIPLNSLCTLSQYDHEFDHRNDIYQTNFTTGTLVCTILSDHNTGTLNNFYETIFNVYYPSFALYFFLFCFIGAKNTNDKNSKRRQG